MLPPTVPLPSPLRANEAGTFAEDTVLRRLPETARRAIAENELDERQIRRLEQLIAEIGSGVIVGVDEPEADDAAEWARHVAEYEGSSWVDVPWFFAETYFYRRLLAATGYSQLGERRGVDPFALQKQLGLESSVPLVAGLTQLLGDVRTLVGASLWANRVDLSLWPADASDAGARIAAVLGDEANSRLLADDTDQVADILENNGTSVHFVLDNAGAELVADLALAAEVVNRQGRVVIHAKPHPTFVSDVTLPDLDATLRRLVDLPDQAGLIGRVLVEAKHSGRLEARVHPFWVSPLPFWQCPDELVGQLAEADLVIVKGDANYRRLLGDLHWDPTTPFEKIVRPKQPLLALRVAKSEVAAGLDGSTIERAGGADPDWMTSGDWGMIQFAR